MTRTAWSALLVLAALWPGRTISVFDGVPLDGVVEAMAIGVALPALWVLHPSFVDTAWVRAAILLLVVVKAAGAMLLTQEGLCARFTTAAPVRTVIQTIPIEEPTGVLHSWDMRADWRSSWPTCTAIVDRPYASWSAFPAWFVNIIDFVPRAGGSPGHDAAPRRIGVDVTGTIAVTDSGRFAIDLDRDMHVTGSIGSTGVESSDGATVAAALPAGVHPLALHLALTGERWKFVPTWNGRSAFDAASMTVQRRRASERWIAPVVRWTIVGIMALLLIGWTAALASAHGQNPAIVAWTMAASAVLAVVGLTGHAERAAGLILLGAAAVPVGAPARHWRSALMLVGVPWLAFFVARSLPQIAHVSQYSADDWLTYQVAGYRIYMGGFWLEGGNKAFDYQPLYRWVTGALHLVFGDSSVGEVYWDAAGLLTGACVAFVLVQALAGFQWGVAAAAATLATFSTGTIWYFVGRGLSEITAAGFAFLAALCLLRSDRRSIAAVTAGVLAILTFYARLNHLVFAAFLGALLIPLSVPASYRDASDAIRALDRRIAVYLATLAVGVTLFAARTWWYTGVFSVVYGTSLKNNDTGLRLSTFGSIAVWKPIGHSAGALLWMNEPPHADPRALLVAAGALLSACALVQLPWLRRLPVAIALATVGGMVSAFFVHTHNYPGRMSIHLVPFAVAMTTITAASLVMRRGVARPPPAPQAHA